MSDTGYVPTPDPAEDESALPEGTEPILPPEDRISAE